MIVKVLAENTLARKGLKAEHGLSLYIETNGYKILFDSGQSDAFAKNAKKMGIDLSKVDFAVLSHGHYDHGGGLTAFLDINKSAPVYVNENAFSECYHGKEKYIGLSDSIDKKRIVFASDNLKITDNIYVCSCNDRENKYDIESYGLSVRKNNELVPDDFLHEQYLVVKENDKKIVVSGCSHKGILNIVNWLDPDVLIGGFHFVKLNPYGAERQKLKDSAVIMMKSKAQYYTCHCTGVEQYKFLKTIMKDRLSYIGTGSVKIV